MDWTWRLDGVVPLGVELAFLAPWPFERTYSFSTGEWDWRRLYGSGDGNASRRDDGDSADRAA